MVDLQPGRERFQIEHELHYWIHRRTQILLLGSYRYAPARTIADAGSNQTVTDDDNNGSESVTLDGSGSNDPDGSITSYVWSEASNQIATGESPTVNFSVGTHNITLTVTDNEGATDTDNVTVIVNPYGGTGVNLALNQLIEITIRSIDKRYFTNELR